MISPKRSLIALARFSLAIFLVVILYLFLLSVFRPTGLSSVPAMILALGCFVANFVFLRTEGKSLAPLGLERVSHPGRKFALGFLFGTLLVGGWLLLLILLLAPEMSFHSPASLPAVANLILFYFFNNAGEELAYRAWAFLTLENSFNRATAIFTTSALFTLLHIQGGMAWANALAGVFTCALILAAFFARSHSLPLTLGFHCATNIAQDLFGLRQTPLALLTLNYSRPASSLNATAVLLAIAALNLAVFIIVLRSDPARSKQQSSNS